MAVGQIYICDWTSPVNGWRYRLEVRPPYNTAFAGLVEPAWGAGAAGGTGYVDIPKDSFDVLSFGDASFPDELPIGLPTTPLAEIEFDLTRLDSSTALEELQAYVVDGKYADGVAVTINAGYSFTADSPTVYRILSDYGNSGLSMSSFYVRFVGVHQDLPRSSYTLQYAPAKKLVRVRAVHLCRAVLEAMPLEAIAEEALDLTSSTYVAMDRQRQYDVLFTETDGATNRKHGIGSGTRGGDSDRFLGRYYYEHTLMTAVTNVGTEIIQDIMRDTSYTFTVADNVGGFKSGLGHWQFKTQPHNNDYTDDGDVSGEMGEVMGFLGAYWQDINTSFATARTAGDLIGGFFVQEEAEGLWSFGDTYTMVSEYVRGCLAKGMWVTGTNGSLNVGLNMRPPLDGAILQAGGSTRTLTRDQVDIEANEEVEVGIAAGVFREVVVTIPEAEGEDASATAAPVTQGILSETDYGVSAFWRTSATVGEDGEWFYEGVSGGTYDANPDLSGDYASVGYPRFHVRKLFYFSDQDGTAASSVPVLPSGEIDIDITGSGTYVSAYSDYAYPIEVVDGDFTTNKLAALQSWLVSSRARFLTNQQSCGLEYGISKAILGNFSNPKQWSVQIPVVSDRGRLAHLGAGLLLKDPDNNPAALNFFTQTDDLLSPTRFPHTAFVTAVNEGDGFSDITLLGVAT